MSAVSGKVGEDGVVMSTVGTRHRGAAALRLHVPTSLLPGYTFLPTLGVQDCRCDSATT